MDASILEDPGEGTIQQSAFEGLFVKVLKVDGDFARELRDAGFDVARQQPTYSSSVFKACIEIAARRVYPSKPAPQGMRLVARQFIDGFFDTILGKVVAVVLPLLSVEAFLKRYPRFFAMAAPDVKMTVEPVAERHWRVVVRDRALVPDFNAGLVECVLERLGAKPEVKVVAQSRWHFELSVTW